MRSLAPLFATCLLGVVALADVAHAGPPQPTSAAGTPLLLFHPAQPTVPLPRRLATPPVAKRGRGAAKSPWDGTYMREGELTPADCAGYPVFNPNGPDDQVVWAQRSIEPGFICPISCMDRRRPRVINNKLVFDLLWVDSKATPDKGRGFASTFHRTQIELPLTLHGDFRDPQDDPRQQWIGAHLDLVARPALRFQDSNDRPLFAQTLRIRAKVAPNTNQEAGTGVFLRLFIGVPANTKLDDANPGGCNHAYPRTDFRFNKSAGGDDGAADTNSCRRECARERRQCLHNCGKDSKCTFGCMDRASDCSNGC